MEQAFELIERPMELSVEGFRFAHARVKGAYVPVSRVSTLDHVAESLERQSVPRLGPPVGIYYDLPYSEDAVERWRADLGYPIPRGATVSGLPSIRVVDLPTFAAVGLRYRGDLTSFPGALQFLVEWSAKKGLELGGPLVERFYVSDALTGVEEREVFIAIAPLP